MSGSINDEEAMRQDLRRLVQSVENVADQVQLHRQAVQCDILPLTLREQTAGSVFVGLLSAYFASNGGLRCTPATLRDIAATAWHAADHFAEVDELGRDYFESHAGFTGDVYHAALASSEVGVPLSAASPHATDFGIAPERDFE